MMLGLLAYPRLKSAAKMLFTWLRELTMHLSVTSRNLGPETSLHGLHEFVLPEVCVPVKQPKGLESY